MRFLSDHLAGDVYFRTSGPDHNLRRARAQLRLLESLVAEGAWIDEVLARLRSTLARSR